MANRGSSECTEEFSDDGTLIGLYLLIAGIILVVFTLVGVFLQKHCGDSVKAEQIAQSIVNYYHTVLGNFTASLDSLPGCNYVHVQSHAIPDIPLLPCATAALNM